MDNFEKVQCNYCENDTYESVLESNFTIDSKKLQCTFVKCNKCGLIYQNPQITNRLLNLMYKRLHKQPLKEKGVKLILFLKDIQVRFSKRIPKIENGKLLDIGCGMDPFLKISQKRGYECYGTDLDSMYKDFYAKYGIEVRTGTVKDSKWNKGYFDIITLWHTLEHDKKPKETLNECNNILKKNGYLVISVPNYNSVERRIFNKYWAYLSPPYHISQFTQDTIMEILKNENFIVDKISYPFLSPQLWTQSILNYLEEHDYIKLNIISKIFGTLLMFPILIPLNIICSLSKNGSVMNIYARKS